MYNVGDKVMCKSSIFLSSDFWLLKGRIYTIKEIQYDYGWVKFEEFRQNAKLHTSNLTKNFYTLAEVRKFKLEEIKRNLDNL